MVINVDVTREVQVKQHPIVQKVLALRLPLEEVVVCGSGPMMLYGLNGKVSDLDLVVGPRAWKRVCDLVDEEGVECEKLGDYGVRLYGGEIEVFKVWGPTGWRCDDLVDRVVEMAGLKWIGLELVLEWKRLLGREKDIRHVALIEEYLGNNIVI